METEFWGVEVKRGEPLNVSPGYGTVLHLSQASLGVHKNEKGKESVSLFVNVDGKKLVLGTLITNKLPQHQFDLLFDREFELSHDWKGGSVYFYGYKASNSLGEDESLEEESDESEFESEDDKDIPLNLANNGKHKSNDEQVKPELKAKHEKSESNAEQEKPEAKAKQDKPDMKAKQQKPEPKAEEEKPVKKVKRWKKRLEEKANQDKLAEAERCNAPNKESDAGKDSVKIAETHKYVNPQDDDESSYEDLMSDDDEEDKSQVESQKKRPMESQKKKRPKKKKAKLLLPHENDGEKAAPLPGNEAAQTPIDQTDKQTPKSGKTHTCKICNKSFGSEKGVEDHAKAKHGDGKQSGVPDIPLP
ncbi:hypothetical protein ACS0TY_016291 [Phlomoides rotata]